ncbi:contractile injection system protein, VgrG/Pvc8 family [Thalassomonas actiniarum]|uniref:Gp5/Type VI secretion system Vgr protein OB-fold domain-containing protein n=1 Tax=Thalassomonas actiniarum TaxID=485447 RepID=A0AAE9YV25_9GAMM|nr:contractile injection system protein, VgrG/Pvc8 family [Thalassomonas actiniarum]WDE01671.1 hypothetical protein SG35_014200 [Thalassomonas actiniarum]
MTESRQPLDLMAIVPERRQTRPLAIKIELGNSDSNLNDDYLRVSSFQGQESVSGLYQFNLELKANEDNPASVASIDTSKQFARSANEQLAQGMGADLLGKWAQLRMGLPYDLDRFSHKPLDAAPGWEDDTPSRFFNGIVTSVSHSAPGAYQLSIQSPLYPLTLRNRYFIYKDMSIEEVVNALLVPETLNYHSHLSLKFKLSGQTITRRQDWLQAGESDFAFLQRVLAKATIHFYFIHDINQLTLVFSNQTTSLQEVTIPGAENGQVGLRYSYTDIKTLGLQQDDLFTELKYEVKMVQQTVRTVLTRQQSVWETNQVAKYTSYDETNDPGSASVDYLRHRCYAYGVDDDEVQGQEQKVCQQLATEEGTLSGTASSALLSPGYTFTLIQAAVSDTVSASRMPAQFNGRTFVVTKISHKASDSESYTGTVEATEVNISEDANKDTLITPFDMQGTQQGSVLAKVLKTAVPKDWRYRNKNNFQTEMSSATFDQDVDRRIGCIVQFATATGADDTHWVALSSASQTAPEVNAMVMIGRAGNESELPEIQQVISSHGQKTIQPPERRANHWTANTSWGSNYSTSFGDGISIRYGNESVVDLPQSIKIVESAYDNPGVLATNYGNSSFNKGSSFGFSVSDNDESGLSNASVSAGCNFSESHSKQNYNVSFTGASQGFSKTNKSVNVSYQGTFSDTINYDEPSFINGKIPQQSIIDICDALADGSTYSQNHLTGKTISLSGTGTAPPTSYDDSATVYSHSITVGKVMNTNELTGDTISESTTTGDTTSTSKQTGNTDSSNTQIGNSKSSNTHIGDNDSTSKQIGNTTSNSLFIGTKDEVQTNISATNSLVTNISAANTIATNISATNTISTTLGVSNNIETYIGAKNNISTSIAASNTISTNIAASNTLSTNISASNQVATNIGASNSTVTNISASNSTSTTIGATNNTETFIGAKNMTSTSLAATNSTNVFIGATNETSLRLAASNSSSVNIGASMSDAMNLSASISSATTMGANISTTTSMGINVNNSTNMGVSVNCENNLGVKAQISEGPMAVETKEELIAKLSGTTAEIVTMSMIL